MSKQVFKYALEVTDSQKVNLPVGAEILTAQMQGEVLCLWALVDSNFAHLTSGRVIRIYGTGHPIHDEGRYVATFQMNGGALIFHVFEDR